MRKLREDNIRTHQLSHDDFLRLMEALPESSKSGPWRPFVATCYYTGMRKGEILKLTWDRVDLKGDEEGDRWFYLRRGDTKTDQARKVPIPEPLVPYLEPLPKETPGFYLFTFRGERWEAKDYSTWRKALEHAKVDDTLHIHDLRHQFVTQAIRAGAPEPFIMEITGHRTRSVFDRYVDANGADLRAVVQRMGTQWTPGKKKGEKAEPAASTTP
ncbi:MAG: site-specific integrase [Nitrospirota bacterium]